MMPFLMSIHFTETLEQERVFLPIGSYLTIQLMTAWKADVRMMMMMANTRITVQNTWSLFYQKARGMKDETDPEGLEFRR